jgi:mannose-6-phosphate isomerase-like protein (cupin superfamily)
MNIMQVKETVFVCIIGCMFVSGCSSVSHGHKAATMPAGEVLVISLDDKPEYQRLLAGRPQTCGMRSGRVYLQPGETCGRHSTEKHEEMLVFLLGKGTALIGEQESPYEVGKGKISYIPPYTIHNIKNTGTEPLVYTYCVTPVTLDVEDHSEQNDHHH